MTKAPVPLSRSAEAAARAKAVCWSLSCTAPTSSACTEAAIRAAGIPLPMTSATCSCIRPPSTGCHAGEVAADLPGRRAAPGQLVAGHVRGRARHQDLLDLGGAVRFALQLQLPLDPGGQLPQQRLLVGAQPARPGVEQAQRTDLLPPGARSGWPA
ncbi:hypothetical protein ABL57_17370 [Kocuria sp. SM24M-10]|nr:hypothetical protein ABL57_17370 [Kocuria sp. SM24M-10]